MLRRSQAIAGLLALSLLLAGCDLVEPCQLSFRQQDDLSLDRRWNIATVNGAAIPSAGVTIPGSTDRLVFGSLHFQTVSLGVGCVGDEENFEQDGRVVAVYNIVNSAGVSKGTKTYAGVFTYNHETGNVILRADKKSITGRRVVNDLSFSASIPFLGDYIVKFQKVN